MHEQFLMRAVAHKGGDIHLVFKDESGHHMDIFPVNPADADAIIEQIKEAKQKLLGLIRVEGS
jgi:hypothetical protein